MSQYLSFFLVVSVFLFCFCLDYKILHFNIIKTNEQESMFEGVDEHQGHMRSIICYAIAAEKEWMGLERQAHHEISKCLLSREGD